LSGYLEVICVVDQIIVAQELGVNSLLMSNQVEVSLQSQRY
jgi:hypothetical protein